MPPKRLVRWLKYIRLPCLYKDNMECGACIIYDTICFVAPVTRLFSVMGVLYILIMGGNN